MLDEKAKDRADQKAYSESSQKFKTLTINRIKERQEEKRCQTAKKILRDTARVENIKQMKDEKAV